MSDVTLPPMPELPEPTSVNKYGAHEFSKRTMRKYATDYAREAVLMERERCAGLCENLPVDDRDGVRFSAGMSAGAEWCAAAIRGPQSTPIQGE